MKKRSVVFVGSKGEVRLIIYLYSNKNLRRVYFTERTVKQALNINYNLLNSTIQRCVQNIPKFGSIKSASNERVFSYNQIRIMKKELKNFFGSAHIFNRVLLKDLKTAHSKFSTARSKAAAKPKLAEISEVASLSQQLEEFREQLILDDFPKAIFILLGDPSSQTHQSLIASIDSLLLSRFQQMRQLIQSELRDELFRELKANLDVANAARQL